jgi:hypothetical protein
VKILNDISDFYHGQELLNYHSRKKNLTEGDQFLTFKPVNSITVEDLLSQISNLLVQFPVSCIGVVEAERSIFQSNIQDYRDMFIPESFFHCHMIAKNTPEILALQRSWVDLNEGLVLSFHRKEVNNLTGLVCYLAKQIPENPSVKVFVN